MKTKGKGRPCLDVEGEAQAPVIDVREIDWNRVWQTRRALRASEKRDARFWDGRANSFAKAASETEYAGRFLEIMKPQPHWTILDMGCGSGTLAVPMARSVAKVTAVDFSPEMLALVRKRCEEDGIGNVTTLEGSWEDDWGQLGIGTYDVAVASRSMVADDLRAAVLKLDRAARERVYIVTIVGDGPFDRRLFDAIGRPLNLGPDYIYNYNLLYQMGIFANVSFITETRRRVFETVEHAVASVGWMFNGLTAAEEKKLKDYFSERFLPDPVGSPRLRYETSVSWAVIWWEKAV